MKQYAFFLDIDGTLAKGGVVHPDNARLIKEAQKMGHYVFINSGRSYSYIPEFVTDCADFDGFVCGLGVDIRIRGEQILSKTFPAPLLENLSAPFLNMPDVVALFEGEERVYYTKAWYDVVDGIPLTKTENFKTKFKDVKISKLTCEPVDKEIFTPFLDELVLYDHGRYYELGLKGYTKANGMMLVAEKLGIPKEQCVAMGDSINDEEMLKNAGIAVVMENGMERTKKLATFVTCNAWDAGVARAIEKIIYA